MRKAIYFIEIILFTCWFFISSAKAQTDSDKYQHKLDGEIMATDLKSEPPTITVRYAQPDQYSGLTYSQLVLRIENDTKITTEAGEVIKKEELKAGGQVSVTYRIKWNYKQKPLWKIAESIILKTESEYLNKK